MGKLFLNSLLSQVRVEASMKVHEKSKCSNYFPQKCSNTCYGNNTVFNKEDIDSGAESEITCFRKGSMSTAGILKHPNGSIVGNDSGFVQPM